MTIENRWRPGQSMHGLGAGMGTALPPGLTGGQRTLDVSPKSERVVLGTVTGASLITTGTARARVTNPSSRYMLGMSIAFEPTNPSGGSINSNSTAWTINAIRPGGDEGREARGHEVQAATNAPDFYEVNSTVREFEIIAALTVPLDAGGAAIVGVWVLVAEWEPAMSLCQEDIDYVYGRAAATLVGARVTL
jgi:hypothetical protein